MLTGRSILGSSNWPARRVWSQSPQRSFPTSHLPLATSPLYKHSFLTKVLIWKTWSCFLVCPILTFSLREILTALNHWSSNQINFSRFSYNWHCSLFIVSNRLYNFTGTGDQDPALDSEYAANLKPNKCKNINDNTTKVEMEPGSRNTFDLSYYTLVLKRRGLFE